MGYTHYWDQHKTFTDGQWAKVCEAARLVAEKHGDILCFEYDETDKSPQIDNDAIRFNGKGDDGHETFYLTREQPPKNAWVERERYDDEGAFNFCKTSRKPYDAAVVLLLGAIRKLAPGVLTLRSDGSNVFSPQGLAALVKEARKAKAPKGSAKKKAKQPTPEHTVELETGNKVCCPAYPQPCTYVRIVDPMLGELAYWDSQEWQEDPQGVMGAIMVAISSVNEDA
jgi:hypothetical protein